ncbi:MAG: helix-turn-helix domain-containing protein [Alphaproteobacteria bacterium]
MGKGNGYGQFCPIAIAAEVVAERWTPLVLRAFFCGATRFNDIQASVPRMSPALLSRRLKALEYANIVARRPAPRGRGSEYALTDAGRALFPVLDAMGEWAQHWLRREITRDENLDPDVLMWELRRTVLNGAHRVGARRVAEFRLSGVPVAKRFYWLVFEPDDVEICVKNPGYPVDLWVAASLRTLVRIWVGHLSVAQACDQDLLALHGTSDEVAAFSRWYALSHFAPAGRQAPADAAAAAG